MTAKNRGLASYDHRTRTSKLPMIIEGLRNLGYVDGVDIPYGDVEYIMMQTVGSTRRTIREYVNLATKLDYLRPATKQPHLEYSKQTIRNPKTGKVTAKEYTVRMGFATYKFGSRVSVSPRVLPSRGQDESSLEKYVRAPVPMGGIGGNNNVVVSPLVGGLGSNPREGLGGERRKEEEEDSVTRTHIYNNVKPNQERERSVHIYNGVMTKEENDARADKYLAHLEGMLKESLDLEPVLRGTLEAEVRDRKEEVCFLCGKPLPENLADTTYYGPENRLAHVSCVYEREKEVTNAE